ncbi:MAG: hypothetical protein ACJ757_06545 [Gaiellaceae bacterium]
MEKSALAWLLLLIVFVTSACGSNPAQERKTFLARANSTCNHFQTLQNNVQFPSINPLSTSPSHADRARWGLALKQIVDLGRDEVRALQKLKPPKDLQARFRTMIDTKTLAFDDLAKAADAAKLNHRTEIKPPTTAAQTKLAQAAKVAKALGLPRCE